MHKLLIIKIGALGDVLRTTCILPGLKKKYPGTYIVWLTSLDAEPLLIHNHLVDELLYRENFESADSGENLVFDLAINLDDDYWACRFATAVTSKKLIGAYSTGTALTYSDDSAGWFDMSLISVFGKARADELKKANERTYPSLLFDMLGISSGAPSLVVPKRERDLAKKFSKIYLASNNPVIGLNTGAGPRWRFKQLSEAKTADLADRLHARLGATLLLYGGPLEVARNRAIRESANCTILDTGHDNSLLEFAAMISLCDVLVTSDSLALHIASCLNTPVIAFFGPTSAAEIELCDAGDKIIPKMNCTCCYLPECNIRPTCMDRIEVNKIIDSVEKIVKIKI